MPSHLAHYTSAAAAVNILRTRRLWLRAAPLMQRADTWNHGFRIVNAAWHGPAGEAVRAAVDALYPGLSSEVAWSFQGLSHKLREGTFVSCLIEHDPAADAYGRTFMLDAYGDQGAGVALVFNRDALVNAVRAAAVRIAPITYADALDRKPDSVEGRGREATKLALLEFLRHAATYTKWQRYRAEREWSVSIAPDVDGPGRYDISVEAVRDVPQLVVALPLPIERLVGGIIIGPRAPWAALAPALAHLLGAAGVTGPEKRIVVSKTPGWHFVRPALRPPAGGSRMGRNYSGGGL